MAKKKVLSVQNTGDDWLLFADNKLIAKARDAVFVVSYAFVLLHTQSSIYNVDHNLFYIYTELGSKILFSHYKSL